MKSNQTSAGSSADDFTAVTIRLCDADSIMFILTGQQDRLLMLLLLSPTPPIDV